MYKNIFEYYLNNLMNIIIKIIEESPTMACNMDMNTNIKIDTSMQQPTSLQLSVRGI